MLEIKQISTTQISITIDISIFNETVISKALYWLTPNFLIYWESLSDKRQRVILEKKKSSISAIELEEIKNKLNQNFIDYKNRDIINKETKDIRTILYIKAFANNDDFEDYNLTTE